MFDLLKDKYMVGFIVFLVAFICISSFCQGDTRWQKKESQPASKMTQNVM